MTSSIVGSTLVGIAGTNGSGKDTAANYLESAWGLVHVSLSDILRSEARKQVRSTDRETLTSLGDALRRQLGAGVLASLAIDEWRETQRSRGCHRGLAISSVRSVGEAIIVKAEGGILLFIDAPQEKRYDNLVRRRREDLDFQTFREFVAQEQHRPRSRGLDTPDLAAVAQIADVTIQNSGSVEEFFDQLTIAIRGATTPTKGKN